MMGAQVGILSAFQLGQHDHLSAERGGVLHAYSRDGAYRKPYRLGALVVHCDNDPVRSFAGVGWDLIKETRINVAQAGRYRMSWEMRNGDNVTNVSARFGVNGAFVGAVETNATNVYVGKTHNYDVNLAAGDLLQIWGEPNGDEVFIQSFRIYYDWGLSQFGDGVRANLVTPLPLSSVDLLDFTAVL